MKVDTIEWGPINDDLLDRLDSAVESYSGSLDASAQKIADVLGHLRAECEAVVVTGLWHDVVLHREATETSLNWDDPFAPVYLHMYPWEFRHEATVEPHARMIQTTNRN
jgi:hypothetical protein